MENTEDGTVWGPPFSSAEYQRRLLRVRQAMASRGIDLLFVSSPPNITYLTGYDSIWYRRTTPTGLAIRCDTERTLFFDSVAHTDLIKSGTGRFDDAIFFDRRKWEPAVDMIITTLSDRKWLTGTAAVERWSLAPHGIVLTGIERRMAAVGAQIIDGSWLVDRVRMVMSPDEIASMRRAAEIADAAMIAVRDAIVPGLTEIEIQGIAQHAMARHGGEEPALRTAIRSGPRGAAHHVPPSRRKLQRGDIVWIDFSASYNRYHADLARIFSVGEPDRRWIELFDKAAKSLDAVIASVKPGEPMRKVHDVGTAYIEAAGIKKYAWLVGGYDIGIAIPPDWVGHTFHSGLGFEEVNFEPGMVTNYENVFDIVTEEWPGGKGGSYIETIHMTERGLEVMSRLDRRLTVL